MKKTVHLTRQQVLDAIKADRVQDLARKTFADLGQDCPRGDCVKNLIRNLERLGKKILAQEEGNEASAGRRTRPA